MSDIFSETKRATIDDLLGDSPLLRAMGEPTPSFLDGGGKDVVDLYALVMAGGAVVNVREAAFQNVDYVSGSSGGIDFNTPGRIEVSTYFDPPDGGTYNLGGADRYWGDISYKTLTDRGCLGWYDEGVVMRDGRRVSDTDALKEIKPHPTRKTPAGRARLDYASLPADVYVPPKRHDGTPFPYDEVTGEYYSEFIDRKTGKKKRIPAQEGAETTALISILLGAVKELTWRIEALEKK